QDVFAVQLEPVLDDRDTFAGDGHRAVSDVDDQRLLPEDLQQKDHDVGDDELGDDAHAALAAEGTRAAAAAQVIAVLDAHRCRSASLSSSAEEPGLRQFATEEHLQSVSNSAAAPAAAGVLFQLLTA